MNEDTQKFIDAFLKSHNELSSAYIKFSIETEKLKRHLEDLGQPHLLEGINNT